MSLNRRDTKTWIADTDKSQGRATPYLWCGGIFDCYFITDLVPSFG